MFICDIIILWKTFFFSVAMGLMEIRRTINNRKTVGNRKVIMQKKEHHHGVKTPSKVGYCIKRIQLLCG
jgi:hypothetical protein